MNIGMILNRLSFFSVPEAEVAPGCRAVNAFRAWRNRQLPEKLAVVERLPDTPEQLQLQGPKKN